MSQIPQNSIHPNTRAEWQQWLEQHHTRSAGVWPIGYKKATGKPRFDYDEAVEEALCFGWIDSKPNKLDHERSMPDGSWSALDAIEALEIPNDLAEAFSVNDIAKVHFEAFPRSAKRGILEWIATAKKAETRARRIEETVRLAAENVRANQWGT
jgi:uncharacterized protein YdeI (YjbR/CyaY-like superfamily)